jgi:tetratricopeptide (TPR) repeat protein
MKKLSAYTFIICVAALGQTLFVSAAVAQSSDIRAAMSDAKHYCTRDKKRDQPERCEEARRKIEPLAQRNWTNVEVLNELGDAYSTFSQSKSKNLYNRVIELDPANATANYRLGLLYQEKDPERAISYFRTAVSSDPAHSDARVALVEVLITTQHNDPTILAQTESALADDPDSWLRAWQLLDDSDIDLLADRVAIHELTTRYLQLARRAPIPKRRLCRVLPDTVVNELIRGQEIQEDFIETCGGYAYLALAKASSDPAEKAANLQSAVPLMPEHIWVHGELARNLIEANAPQEEIVPAILAQLQKQPQPQVETWVAYSQSQIEKGNAQPAEKVLPAILDSSLTDKKKCTALSPFPFKQHSTLKNIHQRYKKLDCKKYEKKEKKKGAKARTSSSTDTEKPVKKPKNRPSWWNK